MIKKTKKTKGIFAAALTAVCAFVAGISLQTLPASAATVAATELVSTSAAVAVETGKGISIASDNPYEGNVRGVFEGNASLKFYFPESAKTGDFILRVQDVCDPTNYFDIEYVISSSWSNGSFTGAYVVYDGMVRTCEYDSAKTWYDYRCGSDGGVGTGTIVYPQFGNPAKVGSLDLVWVGDVLNVKATAHQSGSITHAAFDGTDEFVSGTSWGLPKLAFEDGYTISFRSEKYGSDVVFQQITAGGKTVDLAGAVSSPAFYSDYLTKKWITIGERASYENYRVGSSVEIPTATWTATESTEQNAVDSVKIVKPSGGEEAVTIGGSYTASEAGVHRVVYTAGDDYAYFEFEIVSHKTIAYSELLTVEGATAYYGVNQDGYAGMNVDAAAGQRYDGSFFGRFNGDAEIEFAFPHDQTSWDPATKGENFVFVVSDVNGNETFRIVYKSDEMYTQTYVAFVDERGVTQYRFHSHNVNSAGWAEAYGYKIPGDQDGFFIPALANDQKGVSGKMQIKLDGDIVRVFTQYKSGAMMEIAAFDGTTYNASATVVKKADFTGWGLPKIADRLAGGYKIGFYTGNPNANQLISVTFMSVNGVALKGEGYVDTQYSFDVTAGENVVKENGKFYLPAGEELGTLKGNYAVSIGGTTWGYDVPVSVTVTVDATTAGEKTFTVTDDTLKDDWQVFTQSYVVCVETLYTLSFDTDGGEAIAPIVYSDHTTHRVRVTDATRLFWQFDGWYDGATKYDGDVRSLYGRNVTLKAKWKDVTPPTVYLNGLSDVTLAIKGGKAIAAASDVIASDAAQPDTVTVRYEVKIPSGEWTEVTAGYEIELTALGVYEIRYTVTDAEGFSASVTRSVRVIERNSPVIAVSDGYATQAIVGEEITIASATATDEDGTALTVTVSVVAGGKAVEVIGGKFVPSEKGDYVVSYVAKDAFGLYGYFSYTITAVEDDELPVIVVDFADQEVKKGTVVTVPTATATDNVSKDIAVSVTVTYGTNAVTLSGGTFTASEYGVYTVVYRATDGAGNAVEKVVKIAVKPETASGGSQGGGSGCGSSILGVPVFAALGLGMIAWKKKRENQ